MTIAIQGQKSNKIKQPVAVDDDGNLIVSPDNKINVDTVDVITLVDKVTIVTTVSTVTEVSKSKSYLINSEGTWVNARGSLTGYTLTKDVQSSVQVSAEQTVSWTASDVQYVGKSMTFTIPTGDISAKYFVYVHNPSEQTNLTMHVKNIQTFHGYERHGAIVDVAGGSSSGSITVPKSPNAAFVGTAWNSCFVDTGSLQDESGTLNNVAASDVEFNFSAQNHAIYFGAQVPFDRIRLNIGIAGTYVATTTWEYWNGSAWAALTITGDTTNSTTTDGSASFKKAGIGSLAWNWPSAWAAYDIDGDPISAYWVRCRISAFTSIAVTPEISQGWYKRVGQPSTFAYLIEGVYGGDDVVISLENDTALDASGAFTAAVLIKRL